MPENNLIPKFGNWDTSFPYSQCFDDARNDRSGRQMVDPPDPYEAFSDGRSLAQSPTIASYSEATKLKDEVHIRRDEAIRRHGDQKTSGNHRRTASGSSRESWSSGSNAFASKSASGSRMTGIGDDNKMKNGSIVPKFGDWDVGNPSSGDGFTVIFDKVREEKQARVTSTASMSSDTTRVDCSEHKHKSSGYWCFRWCK